jgi:hypothetical protein
MDGLCLLLVLRSSVYNARVCEPLFVLNFFALVNVNCGSEVNSSWLLQNNTLYTLLLGLRARLSFLMEKD